MIKFLLGLIAGILIFFLFLYFGGGKTVKKIGEELTDTGKKMEVMEDTLRKEKEELLWFGGKKKTPPKVEKESPPKNQ